MVEIPNNEVHDTSRPYIISFLTDWKGNAMYLYNEQLFKLRYINIRSFRP